MGPEFGLGPFHSQNPDSLIYYFLWWPLVSSGMGSVDQPKWPWYLERKDTSLSQDRPCFFIGFRIMSTKGEVKEAEASQEGSGTTILCPIYHFVNWNGPETGTSLVGNTTGEVTLLLLRYWRVPGVSIRFWPCARHRGSRQSKIDRVSGTWSFLFGQKTVGK